MQAAMPALESLDVCLSRMPKKTLTDAVPVALH